MPVRLNVFSLPLCLRGGASGRRGVDGGGVVPGGRATSGTQRDPEAPHSMRIGRPRRLRLRSLDLTIFGYDRHRGLTTPPWSSLPDAGSHKWRFGDHESLLPTP